MARGNANMTGFWSGRFWYDDPLDPAVPFIMNLHDSDGALSGTVSEPDTVAYSGGRLSAFVNGSRTGREVAFAKVYDGADAAAHRVDYSGTLAEDGLTVAGQWSLPTRGGGFEMARQSVEESEAEAVEETAVPA